MFHLFMQSFIDYNQIESQLHDIKVVTGSLIIETYRMRMLSFHIKSISSSQTLCNLSLSSLVKWLMSRKAPLELLGESMFQLKYRSFQECFASTLKFTNERLFTQGCHLVPRCQCGFFSQDILSPLRNNEEVALYIS